MLKVYNRWLDRRHNSKWKPRIYLAVEVLALVSLTAFVYFTIPKPLAVVTGVGVLYFLYFSSLSRYIKVRDRQHFGKKNNSNHNFSKPLDRREKSELKPILYLGSEIFLLALVAYMVSLMKILPLTIIAVLSAIYFFIISSLERYDSVIHRQDELTAGGINRCLFPFRSSCYQSYNPL